MQQRQSWQVQAPACPTFLAQEGETDADAWPEGESDPPTNPLSVVCKQVTREGNFGWEQKSDKQLNHCWGQVLQIHGEGQLGMTKPVTS